MREDTQIVESIQEIPGIYITMDYSVLEDTGC